MEEQQWIQNILAGNNHSFSFLVSKYERMAYNIAIRIVENREEAEEVVQDAFIKAYRALPDFHFESKFSTWFYKIVYRTALTAYKRQLMNERLDDIKDSITNEEIESATSLLERADQKEIIRNILETLSKDDALILNLFYLQECSIEQIHQITDLSISNVKIKLFRARKRFYELLQSKFKKEMKEIL